MVVAGKGRNSGTRMHRSCETSRPPGRLRSNGDMFARRYVRPLRKRPAGTALPQDAEGSRPRPQYCRRWSPLDNRPRAEHFALITRRTTFQLARICSTDQVSGSESRSVSPFHNRVTSSSIIQLASLTVASVYRGFSFYSLAHFSTHVSVILFWVLPTDTLRGI